MGFVSKLVGKIMGSPEPRSAPPVPVPKPTPLPSTTKPQKAQPVPDDKAIEVAERRRVQKLYAGRGRQGSILSGSGDRGGVYG